MAEKVVVPAVAGVFVGGVFTYFLTRPPGMPAEVQVVFDKLTFKDVPPGGVARDFTNRYVYGSYAEGVWTNWYVGYSTPGSAPDDIILELGYNKEDGMITVNIAKHGWYEVQVFFDGVLKATLPAYGDTDPYNKLLPGVLMLMLQERRVGTPTGFRQRLSRRY